MFETTGATFQKRTRKNIEESGRGEEHEAFWKLNMSIALVNELPTVTAARSTSVSLLVVPQPLVHEPLVVNGKPSPQFQSIPELVVSFQGPK